MTTGRVLGAAALLLGTLAAVAGTPRPAIRGLVDVDAAAAMIVK